MGKCTVPMHLPVSKYLSFSLTVPHCQCVTVPLCEYACKSDSISLHNRLDSTGLVLPRNKRRLELKRERKRGGHGRTTLKDSRW